MWDTRKFDKNIKYIVYTHTVTVFFDGQTFHKHIRFKKYQDCFAFLKSI